MPTHPAAVFLRELAPSSPAGFTPALRAALFNRFEGLETKTCPFKNLPEGASWSVERRIDGLPQEVRGFFPSQTITNYSIRKSFFGIVACSACNSGTLLAQKVLRRISGIFAEAR